MNAITQSVKLNMIPGAIPPRINVSQYDDESRTLSFALYNGAVGFAPGSGATAQIQGTKPDGKGFQYDATIDGSTVTATITKQMAAVAGDVRCELVISDSAKVIGTGNFILAVEQAALGEDTDISETVLPDIIDAAESNAERAEAAADRAEEASLHAPYIGANEDWYVWDTVSEQYVDSGVDARGDDGEDGTSIANITKTGSAGLVDTYTVTLTDGTTYTFTVTNGANGTDGQDGADGEDGVGIADIEKTSTVGLVDTYTITLTDQTTYTFTVTNGTSAIPEGGTTGQVLTKLSNTSGDAGWQTPTSGSSSLADLTDTTITSPTDGQVLKYDNATSKWVNAAGGSGGHAIKDNGTAVTNRATLDFTDFDIADDSTNSETDIKAHRLTASELTDIVSPLPGTPITLPILFDETGAETQVGWYKLANGTKKPVYRKDFSVTNSAKSEIILLSNAITRSNSFIIKGYGVKHVGTSGDSNDITFPYANTSASEKPYIYINQNTEGTYLTVYGISIGCEFKVTVLYTKVADTPS